MTKIISWICWTYYWMCQVSRWEIMPRFWLCGIWLWFCWSLTRSSIVRAPNLRAVHFFQHHQFYHRWSISVLTKLESVCSGGKVKKLKEPIFSSFLQTELNHHWQMLHYNALHWSLHYNALHWSLHCTVLQFIQFSASYYRTDRHPDWHFPENLPVIWSTAANIPVSLICEYSDIGADHGLSGWQAIWS